MKEEEELQEKINILRKELKPLNDRINQIKAEKERKLIDETILKAVEKRDTVIFSKRIDDVNHFFIGFLHLTNENKNLSFEGLITKYSIEYNNDIEGYNVQIHDISVEYWYDLNSKETIHFLNKKSDVYNAVKYHIDRMSKFL